ncbi:hypothetical protein LXL04_032364 [Taraxacum kok-saghyz]
MRQSICVFHNGYFSWPESLTDTKLATLAVYGYGYAAVAAASSTIAGEGDLVALAAMVFKLIVNIAYSRTLERIRNLWRLVIASLSSLIFPPPLKSPRKKPQEFSNPRPQPKKNPWVNVCRWVLWHTDLSDVTVHYTKPPFKKKTDRYVYKSISMRKSLKKSNKPAACACRWSLPLANFASALRHTVYFASGKLGQVAYRWLFPSHTVQSQQISIELHFRIDQVPDFKPHGMYLKNSMAKLTCDRRAGGNDQVEISMRLSFTISSVSTSILVLDLEFYPHKSESQNMMKDNYYLLEILGLQQVWTQTAA